MSVESSLKSSSPVAPPLRARADGIAFLLAFAAAIVVKAGLLPVVPW